MLLNAGPPFATPSLWSAIFMKPFPKTLIAVVCLGVAFAFAYFDVFVWLFDDWELDGNYSHGWLVVPIAAYMAWERRHQLTTAELRPSLWGLALLVASMGSLAAGTIAAET